MFGYDNDSRRTSLTLPNGVSMNYGYDAASQLTGITYKNGSTTLGNLTYSYDLAGRRTGVGGTYARTGTPQAASSATYNSNNQLTQWKGASLTYDANGSLTSDGTNIYNWNARNQLVTISGAASATFQYDPFGRRVSKTIGGMTQYLYDGINPVQEISGTTASANLLTGGEDEYFQRTDLAGARNFLTDALGSTLALADSSGTVQTSYTFEPFGNTTLSGATTANSFAYTGRELDATGLYYYRARYYNAQIGRFISEDPMGLFAGVNSFAYVLDSPSNLVDPLGLFCRMSFLDRAKLGGFGVFHVLLGGSKIAGAATATVATDGLAAPLLVYGVPSGVGNLTGGIAEISGAIIGDETLLDSIESISQSATAATTVTGLATLIKTGDLAAAERNSKVEGLFTGGLLGGLRGGMDAYDLGDTAENISDLSKRHTKSMKKCGCE